MDPIADFITAIRNGYLSKKEKVVTRYSKTNFTIAQILFQKGYLKGAEKSTDGQSIEVVLHYLPQGGAVLTGIKRISKPGVRRYVTVDSLPHTLSGAGLSIISTSAGIKTDQEARKAHLGGEVICQVW